MSENKQITKIESYQLEKVEKMSAMAVTLKSHIIQHKLFNNIQGKNYVQVEGWQFAGGLLGIVPRVVSVTNLSSGAEIKWQAEVELVRVASQEILGRGFAVCSNKEGKKKTFDEYSVLSMAQTRAIGKAYRNIIGWIIKLAGYESTPSEEMTVGASAIKTNSEIPLEEYREKLEAVKTIDELKKIWASMPAAAKKEFGPLKDEIKQVLSYKNEGN